MDSDTGLGQYLLQDGNATMKSDDLAEMGQNYTGHNLSQARDDEDLVVAQLINELNSIKEVSTDDSAKNSRKFK